MKFASCLLFFFSIQIYYTEKVLTLSRHSSIFSKSTSLKLRRVKPLNYKSLVTINEMPEDEANTNIGFGVPVQQSFNLQFDTQSFGVWIFSNKYYPCDPYSEVAKSNKRLWKDEDSVTYNSFTARRLVSLKEKNEEDWVFGYDGTDRFHMLGVIRDNTWFTQAVKASSSFAKIKHDGVFGLQYNPKSEVGSLLLSICERMNASLMFSVHYPRIRMVNSDFTDGVLTLCGDDKTKYDAKQMTYVPELNPGSWQFQVNSIDVNEVNIGLQNVAYQIRAKLDTSLNRIEAPGSAFDKLSAILRKYTGSDPDKEFQCSKVKKFPSIQFQMNGIDYFLKGYDYVYELQVNNSKGCSLLLKKSRYSEVWTLGEPFFRKYYVTFDMFNNRIGLAENKLFKPFTSAVKYE